MSNIVWIWGPWQDIVFGTGQWLFAIALIPSILSNNKPSIMTSALNSMVLASFVIAYITMGFYVSAFSATIVAIEWLILLIQKTKE